MPGYRAAPLAITFAGQSLNGNPSGSNSYPSQLLALLQPDITTVQYNTWKGGVAWIQLVDQPGAYAQANAGRESIQSQVGGTTDYALGATGAATYAREAAIAAAARAAGFNHVIGTTTTPSITISGANEIERLAGNLLLTNPAALVANGGQFDAVVDFAGNASLSANIASPGDGTHPTAAGAAIMASMMQTAILALIFD